MIMKDWYFKPLAKSNKILWKEKVNDNYETQHGIRIASWISDYDFPDTKVYNIEYFEIIKKNGIVNNKFSSHKFLYPIIKMRPLYKQIKLIYNLIDCKKSLEYLQNNRDRHAPYLEEDLALKYYLKKFGYKKCCDLGWGTGIIRKLRSGIKYNELT